MEKCIPGGDAEHIQLVSKMQTYTFLQKGAGIMVYMLRFANILQKFGLNSPFWQGLYIKIEQ